MWKLLFTLFIGLPISLFSQDYDNLVTAFSHGDAAEIATHFDASVECAIEGMGEANSIEKAEANLRSFFMTHPPAGFKMVHNGVSAKEVYYMIGEMTSPGETFRVTTYLLETGDAYKIQSIEIEAN